MKINMVDTSPRLMSSSILVRMFWPPLLLDLLLLLLCRRRRRRRRYYCCCCCCSCVRSIKHKTRNSLLRRGCAPRCIAGREAAAATAAAQQQQLQQQQQQQQRRRRRRRWRRRGSSSGQLPFGVSGWLLCCASVAERVCALSVCVYIWLSLVALVARFRPRDKARSV